MTDEPQALEVEEPKTEIDEFKPEPTDLEVREPDDVYRAMDRADEILILDEIQGRALEVFVYDFQHQGKRVTDLSVAGVNEAVRLMNERGGTQIRISPQAPVVEEASEPDENGEIQHFYRVMVYAEDTRGSHGAWGVAMEPKFLKRRNGKTMLDKFALTKALNKSERNAKRKLIPQEFIQTIIAMAKGEGKIRELKSAAAGSVAELPPPLQDERAMALKEKIRAAYGELKEMNRLTLPPARYHAMLLRSEHEHARLEEFLAYIEGLRDKTREDESIESTAEEESS